MRTYIELRRDRKVHDWRVIVGGGDHTDIEDKVVALVMRNHLKAGDTISIYESEMTAEELKLREAP